MAAFASPSTYDSSTTNFASNVGYLYMPSTVSKQEMEEKIKIELRESLETETSLYFLRIHVLIIIIGCIFLIQLLLSFLGLWRTDGAIGLIGCIAFLGLSRISSRILTKAKNKFLE